jgi:hypothetical protein
LIQEGKDPEKVILEQRAIKATKILRNVFEGKISLPPEEIDVLKAIIIKCSDENIYFFARYVLAFDLLTPITHRRWSDDLYKAIYSGRRRLMRLKPRKTYKTTLYGISFILWLWACQSPQIRIFYTSVNKGLLDEVADSLSRFIGSEKNNSFFSYIFAIYKEADAKNTSDVFNIEGRAGKGFSLSLRTSGGSTVGTHPNIIIIDDCQDQDDRDSPTTREGKVRWFDSLQPLLVPFVNPKNNILFESIFFIGTVWHFRDLIWHITEENKKLPENEQWDIERESIIGPDGKTFYPDFISDEKIKSLKCSVSSDIFWACNPGEAPILMSDFTTKRIDEIQVGDKIIGYTLANGMKDKSRLIVSEVLGKFSKKAQVVKVYLESGRIIRCTEDHLWYTGISENDIHHSSYLPAKVGRPLLRVVDCHYKPTFDELLDWRYLGGLLDGEGACKNGQLSLYQSERKNTEVYESMKSVLTRLDIPYRLYRRKDKDGDMQIHLCGGRDIRTKIIRFSGRAKKDQILSEIIRKGRTTYQHRDQIYADEPKLIITRGRDKVVKIEQDCEETVYALETTTGNYVAWGYASKNCQFLNNALPEGLQVFDLKRLSLVRPDQIDLTKGELLCVFDPSLGKSHSDYPAVWWSHYYEDHLTFFDAIDTKVELSLLVHHIASRNKEYGCRKMIFEDNGTILVKQSLEGAHKIIDHHCHIDSVHHSTSKPERIISMQSDLYSGFARFMSDYEVRYPEAMNQIVFYGAYGADDFPDCAQIAIEHYRKKRFVFRRYESLL